MRVTRPEGTVEVHTGGGAGRAAIDVSVSPPVAPVRQPSNLTCWAAGGTMMASWRAEMSFPDDSVEHNRVSHVRIITAIRGTGRAESTFVTLVDSATGPLVTETFTEFDRRHSADDPVRVGVGLFHF